MRQLAAVFVILLATRIGAVETPVNLLADSDDLTAASWQEFCSKATFQAASEPDPEGGHAAFKLEITKYLGQNLRRAIPGHTYLFSAWCRNVTGDKRVAVAWEANPPAPLTQFTKLSFTPEWRRVTDRATCPESGNFIFRFSFRDGDILVWHPMIEDVGTSGRTEPSTYVASSKLAGGGR
jgi:hypothetical protein